MKRDTRLFAPCKVGTVELPNRIVMPPMTTSFAKGGFVTDCMVDYYAERARGGAGLLIVEDAIVDSFTGRRAHDDLFVDDDRFLPGLRRLATAIKQGGARVALNLSHGGKQSAPTLARLGLEAVAPSAIRGPDIGIRRGFGPESPIPRELTIEDIQGLEDRFAQSASRVRQAGFDLVSLHCAHSYLINQFLSPAHNHRTDLYGGDVTGRLRFLLEIIRKIKQTVGPDFPILVRIPVEEQAEGGLTIQDSQDLAQRLALAGVACISASVDLGARSFRIPPPVAPMRFPRGCMVYLAAAVKEVVSIPVMTANRIVTPQLAEEILERGEADLIGIGRGLIADPDWPRKAREGREAEIRHCLGCLRCSGSGTDMRCTVNAAVGQEDACRVTLTSRPKTVFIAGGGPAGLEAARVSALRGHRVVLFEKDRLGGQLNLACIPPGKVEIKLLLEFEQSQLDRLGVTIVMKKLTHQDVVQEKPDVVIVATGARPTAPALPGADKSNVVSAWQVLKGEVKVGSRAVVLGGGQAGAEVAEYMAGEEREVTVVARRDEIAADEHPLGRAFLLRSLSDLGVKLLTRTTAEEIVDGGVAATRDGRRIIIAADTVVTALRADPDQELAEQLEGLGIECYVVGDCAAVRKLSNAIEDGFKAALDV